ncbi:hypothetical protein [Lacipirellula sp.]|uniref:hypothetical protein n=1 Tax=Lacipirellula sp. TaxID=2691419 RepID=UPI003D0D49D3
MCQNGPKSEKIKVQLEGNDLNPKPKVDQPPAIDLAWSEYEDISISAAMAGIKYPVLLDPRIRTLVEREIDPVEFERAHRQEPLGIFALIGLRFLLDRFPSMTRFRYSIGPPPEEAKVPVIATFHHDEQRGYFLALTLDVYGTELNA